MWPMSPSNFSSVLHHVPVMLAVLRVALDPGSETVFVRNSRERQELKFDFREWSAFVTGVKRGEFDQP